MTKMISVPLGLICSWVDVMAERGWRSGRGGGVP